MTETGAFDLAELMTGTSVLLRLLQARLLTLLALLMTAGIFWWAMWLADPIRVTIATIWALLVFLPILWMGRKGHDHGS